MAKIDDLVIKLRERGFDTITTEQALRIANNNGGVDEYLEFLTRGDNYVEPDVDESRVDKATEKKMTAPTGLEVDNVQY